MSHNAEIQWVEGEFGLHAVLVYPDGHTEDVEWAPQPGSQTMFLACPLPEALYCGTRGPGKTDALIMDFAQHVGQGFGAEWRGILFRRTHPELEDVIAKSKKWFGRVFPDATYNESKSVWTWPTGETLRFRHFAKQDDYWSYHGHAYPWIAWEELTTWPTDECFRSMMSCLRSPMRGIPIKLRATTNPYGVGHHWVKERYRLPVPNGRLMGRVVKDSMDSDGNVEPARVAIHGTIQENRVLLSADPTYIQRIAAAARNPSEKEAWLYGSWDIISGGMFDDVWDPLTNVVPDLLKCIPPGWTIDRSFDWGSSKPFSIGWWAESDGSPLVYPNGKTINTLRGDLFRVAEWYGWTGKPNKGLYMTSQEIAEGIRDKEEALFGRRRVRGGPADASIWDPKEGDKSVQQIMARAGVQWTKANKNSGSRKNGWERIRELMQGARPQVAGQPRERVGMFVSDRCDQFLRTVPALPRDDKDLDDVDTDSEDHVGDEVRYRVYQGGNRLVSKRLFGR